MTVKEAIEELVKILVKEGKIREMDRMDVLKALDRERRRGVEKSKNCEICLIKDKCYIYNDFLGTPHFDEIVRECCPLVFCIRAKYKEVNIKLRMILPRHGE